MKSVFDRFKGLKVENPGYTGIVCGYTDCHIILAVETKIQGKFFRTLKKDFYVEEEFKDPKYRYIFEDESTIEKQFNINPYGSRKENQGQQAH